MLAAQSDLGEAGDECCRQQTQGWEKERAERARGEAVGIAWLVSVYGHGVGQVSPHKERDGDADKRQSEGD